MAKKAEVDKSKEQPAEVEELKKKIDESLSSLVFSLDATANTVSSVNAVSSAFYGFTDQPPFLEKWTRFGPAFISPVTMKLIGEIVGIDKLNNEIERRLEVRKNKNWVESDRIRDELAKIGVVLKDGKDGTTTWDIAR